MKKNKIKIGDLVKVKKGIFAPDQEGICMEGWQGEVFEKIEDKDGTTLISIEWDSITLENMPESYIEQGKKEKLNNGIFMRWNNGMRIISTWTSRLILK